MTQQPIALVTRPEEDAARLVAELRTRGIEPLVEPLLRIRQRTDVALDLDGVQALLFTSANGARAFAAASPRRDLGVLAVGDATAAAARDLGFPHVESAVGDVESLAALVLERLRPERGALFHAAGSVTAGDLAGRLGGAGFTVRRVVLYEAEPASALSAAAASALAQGAIRYALFFSPRTAAAFVRLCAAEELAAACRAATAFCLSAAVAAALEALPWRGIIVAAAPRQAELLAALDQYRADETGAAGENSEMEEGRAGASEAEPTVPPSGPTATAAPPGEAAAVPRMSPTTPGAPPPPRRGSVAPWLLLIILILIGGIAASPWWAPPLQPLLPWAVEPGGGEADARIAALEQRLKALEQRPAPAAGDASATLEKLSGQIAALDRRLGRAEAMIAELQQRPAATADNSNELRQLATRLAALEGKLAEPSPDAASLKELQSSVAQLGAAVESLRREGGKPSGETLLLALGQLREAMRGSGPFAEPLAAAQALVGDRADVAAVLARLKEPAGSGVPSLALLRQRFETSAGEIASAAGVTEGESGWIDTILRGLHIRARKVGPGATTAEGPDGNVARAEQALGAGDLAVAIAALEGLRGAPALAAKPWLDDAKRRVAADAALDEAAKLAATRLAEKKPG